MSLKASEFLNGEIVSKYSKSANNELDISENIYLSTGGPNSIFSAFVC